MASVFFVMSFGSSSSVYPTASLAAILAIGNPVALLARADDRETRGFISITTMRPVAGSTGELDVAAARLDADLADDADGGVPHRLVLAIGERLGGGHRDGVAGVHAHRIDVLDAADDDHVVRAVPHDLELELLPAEDALFDEDLAHRRELEAATADLGVLVDVPGDAAPRTAEGERRSDHTGEADLVAGLHGVLDGPDRCGSAGGRGLSRSIAARNSSRFSALADDRGAGGEHL